MYLGKQLVKLLFAHKKNVYEWRNAFGFMDTRKQS